MILGISQQLRCPMAATAVLTIPSSKSPAQKGSKHQIKQMLRLVQRQLEKSPEGKKTRKKAAL